MQPIFEKILDKVLPKNSFSRMLSKLVKKSPKFLYAGFLSHWGTVAVLINGVYYKLCDSHGYKTFESEIKEKVKPYLKKWFDINIDELDSRAHMSCLSGWYLSHLYGLAPPGATMGLKLSIATALTASRFYYFVILPYTCLVIFCLYNLLTDILKIYKTK